MKKITLLAAIPLFMLLATPVRALIPVGASGPVTFHLTASAQNQSYANISNATNHTSTSTNTVAKYKSSVTNNVISNAGILGLLANSFNTNLPPDAKLVMSGLTSFSFFVMDKTGTNLLLTTGDVLSIVPSQSVNSGAETFVLTTTGVNTIASGNDTEVFTDYVTLSYNDGSQMTADGTSTQFQLTGLLRSSYSRNILTGKMTVSATLQGAGGGTIRNKECILKGTLGGALSKPLL